MRGKRAKILRRWSIAEYDKRATEFKKYGILTRINPF
jgi:hypothetical protein